MLGSALIKLRGDPCWRDLTCLDFHFETQPIPSPLTPLFHFMPHWVHALGVQFNFVAELVAPFFVFGPKHARRVAGLIVIAFQLTLIASGNLSFLNWLTLIPALACLDDGLFGRVVLPRLRLRAHKAAITAEPSRAQTITAWAFAALIGALSIEPVLNLLSAHQVMNTGHDPFELVNSYGAFGTVGKERRELVFEGTRDEDPATATWLPYEFKCKPGDPSRRPCWMSPYHYRLDWQVWFAAMGSPDDEPWTVHLIWKLLHNDPLALGLIADNPFPDAPPKLIRVRQFRYRLLPYSGKAWWEREEIGPWLPPLAAGDPELKAALDAYGWR
jgi:hypothetical protein